MTPFYMKKSVFISVLCMVFLFGCVCPVPAQVWFNTNVTSSTGPLPGSSTVPLEAGPGTVYYPNTLMLLTNLYLYDDWTNSLNTRLAAIYSASTNAQAIAQGVADYTNDAVAYAYATNAIQIAQSNAVAIAAIPENPTNAVLKTGATMTGGLILTNFAGVTISGNGTNGITLAPQQYPNGDSRRLTLLAADATGAIVTNHIFADYQGGLVHSENGTEYEILTEQNKATAMAGYVGTNHTGNITISGEINNPIGGSFRTWNGGNAEWGAVTTNEDEPYFYLEGAVGWTFFSHRFGANELWITEGPPYGSESNKYSVIHCNIESQSNTLGGVTRTNWYTGDDKTSLSNSTFWYFNESQGVVYLTSSEGAGLNFIEGTISGGWSIEDGVYLGGEYRTNWPTGSDGVAFTLNAIGTNAWLHGRTNLELTVEGTNIYLDVAATPVAEEVDPDWAAWVTNAAAGSTNAILPDGSLVDIASQLAGGGGITEATAGQIATNVVTVSQLAESAVYAIPVDGSTYTIHGTNHWKQSIIAPDDPCTIQATRTDLDDSFEGLLFLSVGSASCTIVTNNLHGFDSADVATDGTTNEFLLSSPKGNTNFFMTFIR